VVAIHRGLLACLENYVRVHRSTQRLIPVLTMGANPTFNVMETFGKDLSLFPLAVSQELFTWTKPVVYIPVGTL
jgi:hypothetical protein